MPLFVYMYRNIKGLSAAIFMLCHPVDLLTFNQKKISFYMLLQNSKRWYMVITDKTEQSKRRKKLISVLYLVLLFSSSERVKGKVEMVSFGQ